ncbi:outer membrane protein assembly factor BamC [Endozoicomonas acroporae]|uniref:outer membrane protein assembly factor BamC n=1 Tax=Endozoicomonas acroporae TaxID=1701104 RepID=UPI000C75D008|nr:outer membrane protein assembly factor BamC [Endozoicomonas acroporae]
MVPGQRISELPRHARLGLSVVISALVLTGCANPFGQQGYLRDRAGDYIEAQTAEPITLPAGTQARELGDILVIPEAGLTDQKLPREFEVPRPSQRLMLKEGDHYSLERNGSQEWLSVDRGPGEVLPGVLGYIEWLMEELGVGIASTEFDKGVVETQWHDFGKDKDHGVMYRTFGKLFGADDLEPMEERFRFEVRNGLKGGTTEVYVYHQGRPLAKKGKPAATPENWDNLGETSKRKANDVLAEMLVYLARDDVQSSVSLQAQGLDIASVTEAGRDGNGNPVLTVRGLSYARVWDAVANAMDNAGLKVVDRNRSAGLFYLADSVPQLEQEQEKKSFWSGWFSDEQDTDVSDEQKTLTVRVSNYSEAVQLSVEKDVNTSAPADVSQRLLKVIQDNLQ